MAGYNGYNPYANQVDEYSGQGSYPEQRHGGSSQTPHPEQQYGYTTSQPYQGDTPSYSSYEELFHHSGLSPDLESTHNDFNGDYNDELPPLVPESEKLDPQGRDADQETKDRKEVQKRRDSQEQERRVCRKGEATEPRQRRPQGTLVRATIIITRHIEE